MVIDWDLIQRLFRFGVVGTLTFFIDFGLTYFGKEKLKLNKFVANAIGYIVAVIINFTLNRIWTFNSQSNEIFLQFTKFVTIAIIALLLNTIIIYILNVRIKLNFYLSKLIAVFIVMFYNYSMNAIFTFNQ